MKAATLFSGIGAPECARPDWEWLWHAEVEDFPSAVLAARHPKSVNLGDVNAEDFAERALRIGRPDVLVWGSPCQDWSVAGKRLGLDGGRANLAMVALRLAREIRPAWMVFENVPGLFSSYSGSAEAERALGDRAERGTGREGESVDCEEDSDFAAFLSAVRECGYLGCYRVLDAQFAGVPQRRRRVFAVFRLGDWRGPAAVLLEPESLRGDPAPSRETGERVAPTVEARANAGGAGWGTDFLTGGGLATTEVAASLRTGYTPAGHGHSHGLRGDGSDNLVAVEAFNNTGQGWWDGADAAQAVRKGDDGGGGGARESTLVLTTDVAGCLQERDSKGVDSDTKPGHLIIEVCPTLRAGGNQTGGHRPPGTDVDTADSLIIAFDTTQITHPENRSRPDDRSPQLSESGHPPAIAFDCKAGGDTSFAVGDELAGSLRGDGNGGGHAAVLAPGFISSRVSRNSHTSNQVGIKPDAEVSDALNSAEGPGAVLVPAPEITVFKPSHFTRDKDSGPSETMPPLTADADKGDQDPVLLAGAAVRRLTPEECEALQAFERGYTKITYRGKIAADGPRYRAVGNAMCVNEVKWILDRIEAVQEIIDRG